jgi:hypothetical protein
MEVRRMRAIILVQQLRDMDLEMLKAFRPTLQMQKITGIEGVFVLFTQGSEKIQTYAPLESIKMQVVVREHSDIIKGLVAFIKRFKLPAHTVRIVLTFGTTNITLTPGSATITFEAKNGYNRNSALADILECFNLTLALYKEVQFPIQIIYV